MNEFSLRVPASHPVFDGHFPGNPIVPGAYLLALVCTRANEWLRSQGSSAIASGVRSVKFVRPVRPDESCDLVFSAPAERSLRFSVSADGVVCASGMFVLNEPPPGGPGRGRRAALAALLIVPTIARLPPARATQYEMERLFAGFAALGQRRARFVERRYSALTRTPLESRGELLFKPPATLERVTLFPQREVIRIEGEQVTVRTATAGETGEQTIERRFRLDSVPQLAQLAEALRATLAGDLTGLQRVFRVTLPLPPPRWRLRLEPLDESAAATLRLVNVTGRDTSIERFEMFDVGGDRTELQIAPL